MAENLVVNEVTYPEVEALLMTNEAGEQVGFYPDAVRYSKAQSLTDAQKAQARGNVGAASAEEVSLISSKVDRKVEQTDLEAEVATQLDGAKGDIVAELFAQIGGMPIFGTVDDDNQITVTSTLINGTYDLMYEKSDGTLEKIGTVEVTNGDVIAVYTNQVPLANAVFDGSGAVYNTGVTDGYKNDYRLSSSYAEKANTGTFLTGFILVSPGDTVYFSEGTVPASNANCKVVLWKTDGYYDIEFVPNSVNTTTGPMFEPYEFYDDGSLKSLTMPTNRNTKSFRIVGLGSGADAICTVNEPLS